MGGAEGDHWTERLRQTLWKYDEGLLRQVAGNLCRPRNQWPAEELIERSLSTLINPAVLDRRLKELAPASRRLLAVMGHSRQPVWRLGNLIELSMTLGESDGLPPVVGLLEGGLLYPNISGPEGPRRRPRFKSFEHWLTQGMSGALEVFALPEVGARAVGTDLGLPECPDPVQVSAASREGFQPQRKRPEDLAIHEADGLEWPLRLSALWQQVTAASLRRTQQRDFFKRDLERLRGDALLAAAPADSPGDIPDPGLLAVALALHLGLVQSKDRDGTTGELVAGQFPQSWSQGLPAVLAGLWSALPHLETWNVERGYRPGAAAGDPFPSACILCLLLLSRLPDGSQRGTTWARPEKIAEWIKERHPYWHSQTAESLVRERAGKRQDKPADPIIAGLARFLLGLAYSLKMVQAAREPAADKRAAGWLVRLSSFGRWLLGLEDPPPPSPHFPQTLLVQPNLEILAYRQGLTPEIIARLSRFAAWKGLGAACTLQLQPDTVYRALEAGESFESIVQVLEGRGLKALPAPVVEALRTWSNKRERIQMYPSAALLEFTSATDLQEAIARGLPAVRLTDRLAVVANESDIDFRHFRLTGTRDYCLPPEKCVTAEPDGVTLTIDQSRSDLLLETELQRFAEPVPRSASNGKWQYRLTPSSLAAARQNSTTLEGLETWYHQRCGQAMPPAVRLLLTGADTPPPHLRRQLVLTVASPDIADGLQQWPGTRSFIQARLGPTALAVDDELAGQLQLRLQALGIVVQLEEK